jgi:hypothetical protein
LTLDDDVETVAGADVLQVTDNAGNLLYRIEIPEQGSGSELFCFF